MMDEIDDLLFYSMDLPVTLKMCGRDYSYIEKQPQSNISTLPSEDEMNLSFLDELDDDELNVDTQTQAINDTAVYTDFNSAGNTLHSSFVITSTNKVYSERITDEQGVERKVSTFENQVSKTFTQEQMKKEAKKKKNQESARRSRNKKKEEMENERKKNSLLESKNGALKKQIADLELNLAVLKVNLKKHACVCGVEEQNDDLFNETGCTSKAEWTNNDVKVVDWLYSMKNPVSNIVNFTSHSILQTPVQETLHGSNMITIDNLDFDINSMDRSDGTYDVNQPGVNNRFLSTVELTNCSEIKKPRYN